MKTTREKTTRETTLDPARVNEDVPTAPTMTEFQRRVSMALCLLTMVLAILDQNIVSAAIVPIVRDLDPAHGVDHVAWLVAAFALAATVVLPLYGRLCDVLGAKHVYLAAIATFLLGSVLCGMARSMTELIAFRAIQGIGAGGLMSVTLVVMAQLRKPGDKGGPGALAGIMGGSGMALGPFVGGLFADHGNWRMIFFVNVPLGLIIIGGALWALRLPRHTTADTRIDFVGAALVAVFASALLLACQWGGEDYAWDSATIVGLLVAAAVGLGLFLWRQATIAMPILPLSLFRNAYIRNGFLLQGLTGAVMLGTMVYLMLYLQLARGVDATAAGAYLAFMALGMVIAGIVGTRLPWSTRSGLVAGTALAGVAFAGLALLDTDTSLWVLRGDLFILGLGFGQLVGRAIVAVQQAAPREHLGVTTTGIRFFQSLAGTLSVALFGSVLARVFTAKSDVGEVSAIAHLAPAEHADAVRAFVTGVDVVFAGAAGLMVLALLCALRMPDPRPAVEDASPAPANSARAEPARVG
ncbi:MFS transporter [Embleya sp. NBC_00888]|uniref:MFS transporter n=1 Tax=Embleya sp. NBC_00888 TaxID=2975960 RepID=UPI00386744C2|nr:MFS transporter [Embleya sp. NBC_00888]